MMTESDMERLPVNVNRLRKPLRITAALVVATTLSAKAWAIHAGLVRVTTPSVQPGYYRTEPLRPRDLARGTLVCIESDSEAAPRVLRDARPAERVLIKRVAGLPGDVIDYDGARIMINGRALADSPVLASDARGNELPRTTFPVVLGADEVWLTSDHERGFDSRYFGPVRRAALTCRAELLWAR